MLNCNTKQTYFKKSWDALEIARFQEFMCPRWRAELKLVPAPSYIRIWLPVLADKVLKEFGQIFRTRPNLVRPWASRMQHVYGAITHQFDSVFSVEGRNGSRLLVYQDRDVKTLNVFWPLFYSAEGSSRTSSIWTSWSTWKRGGRRSARAMSQAGGGRGSHVPAKGTTLGIATVMSKGAAIVTVIFKRNVGANVRGSVSATAIEQSVATVSLTHSGGASNATAICTGRIARR